MRILQICNKFPYPPKDGGVIATFSMLKGFYITGHAITIATINTSKHYTNKASLPFEIARMAEYYDVYKYTNPHIFGALWNLLLSCKPYTATRFASKKFEKTLEEILHSHTYDIIQIEGLYMCQYIPLIRKFTDAKIVYRAHNVEFEIWDRLWKGTKNPIKKAYFYSVAKRVARFEKAYINTYDMIVPITQRDLHKYTELGNRQPSFVAPTGVFVEDFVSKPFSKDISLFHIGGLDWAPNQQGLLWFIEHCWAKIRESHPTITFKIAGRNAPKWFVDQMKAPGVEFVGEVESSREFMTSHAIMVVPLLAGSGMRIKIIEGLAYGKVIVSTSVGAEGISAQHKQEIYIANSAEAFIKSITELIKNPELFHSIEKNAVTFVHQTYDNNKIIQELIDFYLHYVPRN